LIGKQDVDCRVKPGHDGVDGCRRNPSTRKLLLMFWVIQTLNGISFGMLLFLLAAGLSLIYGLMKILNLTHGSFYLWGGYIGFFQDPDGHLWEVAHNPQFPLSADGHLTLPD